MKAENWHRSIDVAAQRHRKPSKSDIVAVARELFPVEMELADAAALDRGHKRELGNAMRQLANLEEAAGGPSDPLPELPGLDPPAYLTVPDEDGGFTVVKYRSAFRPERLAAIVERRQVARRGNTRADDLERKEVFLAPWTPNDETTVEEALKAALRRSAAELPVWAK